MLKDIRLWLIIILIVVSTGHVGRLFADREHRNQAVIGYILAVAIDGVLTVSLYDITRFKKYTYKRFSFIVFTVTCVISAGFNTAYYRQNYPSDYWLLSLGLGSVSPILASFLAIIRGFVQEEQESIRKSEAVSDRAGEQDFELEKYRIEQEANVKVAAEKERTKQANARAREAKYTVQKDSDLPVNNKKRYSDFMAALQSGELTFDMTGVEIGKWAGKGSATGRRWKREYRKQMEGYTSEWKDNDF